MTLPDSQLSTAAPARSQAANAHDSQEEITILSFVNALLRRRRMILLLGLLGGLIMGARNFSLSTTYTAESSIMPNQRAGTAASSLAQRLGFQIEDNGSVQFYAELVESGAILRPIVKATYTYNEKGRPQTGSLIDIYRLRGSAPAVATKRAIDILSRSLRASASSAGLITISVTSSNPELSAAIANRVVQQLAEFNLGSQRSSALGERRFIEERVVEAQGRLRDAEDRLQVFMQQNVDFARSPRLSFERDRLARDVEMRQQVYTNLVASLEQARIDAVRDTPSFTVLEIAEPPLSPDPLRSWARNGTLGLVAGLMLGALLAVLHAHVARARGRSKSDYEEFAALRNEAVRDLRRPVEALMRKRVRGGHRASR